MAELVTLRPLMQNANIFVVSNLFVHDSAMILRLSKWIRNRLRCQTSDFPKTIQLLSQCFTL